MTPKVGELFEDLGSRLNPDEAAGLDRTIQWQITDDENPGVWAFKINDGTGELIPGGVPNPDATFVTDSQTWIGIAEGRLEPMRQFMAGKLKVNGDMMLALKVPKLFPIKETEDV